jgi:hypothetical protein
MNGLRGNSERAQPEAPRRDYFRPPRIRAGVASRRSDSTFDGNGTGFYVLKKVRLQSSSASNNQRSGYYGMRLIAEDSAIDNNCLTPDPGCADVVARRHPRLINTSCATSLNDVGNYRWNVCSED